MFKVSVTWGVLASMDEKVNPPKTLLLKCALKHWDLGVQGFNIACAAPGFWSETLSWKTWWVLEVSQKIPIDMVSIIICRRRKCSFPMVVSMCWLWVSAANNLFFRSLRPSCVWAFKSVSRRSWSPAESGFCHIFRVVMEETSWCYMIFPWKSWGDWTNQWIISWEYHGNIM